MKLNISPDWLVRMAEKEDGQNISVGGLATKINPRELPDCPDCRNDELYLFGNEIRCYCCRFAAPKQDYSECFEGAQT